VKKSDGMVSAARTVEILVATVLFFAMLCTCGMYIDIKINGQSSSLPPVPAGEKQILLKKGASENTVYSDDLLEPLFVGIKNADKKVCAAFDSETRKVLEDYSRPYLYDLFSGTWEKQTFPDENAKNKYINSLKERDNYILVSYFNPIPAAAFLPCLSDAVEMNGTDMTFSVKHVFITGDEEGKVSGVVLSETNDVYKLYGTSQLNFDKISAEEYDVNDGYSYFDFYGESGVIPVMTTSFVSNKLNIRTLCSVYGKNAGAGWVNNLFDMFSVNDSLVKSYSSKNDSEMIYVDDENEIIISDDGTVEYTAGGTGVSLDTYLNYPATRSEKYTFNEKIFAVKKLINSLKQSNDLTDYTIVGIDYEKETDSLSVYLKCFACGISVTENNYDAVFTVSGNSLVYAKYRAFVTTAIDEVFICVNQQYSNVLFDETENTQAWIYCMLLEQEEPDGNYIANWARLSSGGKE